MGIAKILDLSFQIYRKHFVKLYLLMLILIAPINLVLDFLINDYSRMSFLPSLATNLSMDSFMENLANQETDGAFEPLKLFLLLAAMMLFWLGTVVAQSSIVFMVQSVSQSNTLQLKEMLKSSLKRLGSLVGSTFVFTVILFVVAVIVLFVGFGMGFSIITNGDVVGVIVITILMLVLIPIALSFFFIRWGYYIPFVALEGESIGLGKSWHLTKGNFWRLCFIYFVILVITYIFVSIFNVIFMGLFETSIIGKLLIVLFDLILTPLLMVTYAVTYFDLKVRKEGIDLQDMIQAAAAQGQDFKAENSLETGAVKTAQAGQTDENIS